MALAEKSNFKLESALDQTSISFTLNVGEILSKLDEFSKNEYVEIQHAFCGGKLVVKFYPKGQNRSASDRTSMHCSLTETNGVAPLKMHIEVRCGSRRCQSQHPFDRFEQGHRWKNFFSHRYLRKHSAITVFACVSYTQSVGVPAGHDFLTQCKSMSELSNREGDITLQVNLASEDSLDNDGSEEGIEPPPTKRRKLNSSSTSTDNKNGMNPPRRSTRLAARDSGTASVSQDERKDSDASEERSCSSSSSQSSEVTMVEVRASSILLKAASPVFKRMLESNMIESREKTIQVSADSVDAVNDMLYFLWTNELPVPLNANVFSLLKLANFYALEGMKIACINHAIQQLSVDNFVGVVNTLNQYSIKEGMNAVIEFANKNRQKIIERNQYQELPFMFQMTVLQMGK